MIHRFNQGLLCLALLICVGLYSIKHEARLTERHLTRLAGEISDEREMLRLLQAEWAMRTEPERLQRLADRHLDMVPVSARQIVTLNTTAGRALPPLDLAELDRPVSEHPAMAARGMALSGSRISVALEAGPAGPRVAQNAGGVAVPFRAPLIGKRDEGPE